MTYELDGRIYQITCCEAEHARDTSVHALVRVMQRFDVSEKRAMHIIRCAKRKGRQVSDLPQCRQRRYVERQDRPTFDGHPTYRVYQDFLFVFAPNEQLITAYELPGSFHKRRKFDRNKQAVRNFSKYRRMFPDVIVIA